MILVSNGRTPLEKVDSNGDRKGRIDEKKKGGRCSKFALNTVPYETTETRPSVWRSSYWRPTSVRFGHWSWHLRKAVGLRSPSMESCCIPNWPRALTSTLSG